MILKQINQIHFYSQTKISKIFCPVLTVVQKTFPIVLVFSLNTETNKVRCVVPMVFISLLPLAEFGPNDAPHFTSLLYGVHPRC